MGGTSNNVIASGWSFQEPRHRWTDGSEVALGFKIKQRKSDDLVLRLLGSPYLAQGEIDQQAVDVIINNQQVAKWIMREGGWFEAPIRASLVGEDGLINVVFKISDPASPAEFSHSNDSRKLGMAVRELVIKSVH
jgi:hypothetical protein